MKACKKDPFLMYLRKKALHVSIHHEYILACFLIPVLIPVDDLKKLDDTAYISTLKQYRLYLVQKMEEFMF